MNYFNKICILQEEIIQVHYFHKQYLIQYLIIFHKFVYIYTYKQAYRTTEDLEINFLSI